MTVVVYHLVGRTGWSKVEMRSIKTQNGNLHGMRVFHFHGDEYKPKDLQLVAKSKRNALFPFGNFGLPFQEIPFSPEIFRLGSPNMPTEISGFWG